MWFLLLVGAVGVAIVKPELVCAFKRKVGLAVEGACCAECASGAPPAAPAYDAAPGETPGPPGTPLEDVTPGEAKWEADAMASEAIRAVERDRWGRTLAGIEDEQW